MVGGGAAGLSAALVLGRARRRTLLVDAGNQSNLAAAHIGGMLGSDRRPAPEFYAAGREELGNYPAVEVRDGDVAGISRDAGAFTVQLADGSSITSHRVLLATGMEYRPPDIPGIAERWGGAVFHCPFCHGWEVSGKPLAVLEGGDHAVTRALMLRAWSDDVTLLTGGESLDAEGAGNLADAGIAVDERSIAELRGPDTDLETVVFEDGGELAVSGLMVGATLHQRSDLAARLGVAMVDKSPLSPDAIELDATQQTSVPGVYAAGDVIVQAPSVASSVASGHMAGTMIVKDLTS